MSRQAQYAQLGVMHSPGSYARNLLRDDVLPLVPDFEGLSTRATVRELSDDGLVASHNINDVEFLALCLHWIVNSKLTVIPTPIVNQVAGLASRIFDQPQIKKAAISEFQASKRLGQSTSDTDQKSAVDRAIRRLTAKDARGDVVRDLATTLKQSERHASRLLTKHGFPGTSGRAKKKSDTTP